MDTGKKNCLGTWHAELVEELIAEQKHLFAQWHQLSAQSMNIRPSDLDALDRKNFLYTNISDIDNGFQI